MSSPMFWAIHTWSCFLPSVSFHHPYKVISIHFSSVRWPRDTIMIVHVFPGPPLPTNLWPHDPMCNIVIEHFKLQQSSYSQELEKFWLFPNIGPNEKKKIPQYVILPPISLVSSLRLLISQHVPFKHTILPKESQISPIQDIKKASLQPDLPTSVKLGGVVKWGGWRQYYLVLYVTTGQQYKLATKQTQESQRHPLFDYQIRNIL